jgi:hypothetical protein
MNFFNRISLLLVLLFSAACSPGEDKKQYILTEKDLIPEGTAFDSRTGTIYISSTFKRKIVQITSDGKVSDFISEKSNGIASVLGMEVDEERGVLWTNIDHANEVLPLKDPHPTEDWKSSICSFDIQTKKLIKRYNLQSDTTFLNDLTVLPTGELFATESVHNKIYCIRPSTDSLELFLSTEQYHFLNGITYSDKWNCLFVSAEEGIISIDLSTKKYYQLKTKAGINTAAIDGLTLYKDRLIGHQSTKVVAFYLNETGSEIIQSQLLDTGVEFDSSTTGEVGGEYYHFIVNAQVRSGIDRVHKTTKPLDSLEEVIIRRIRL